MRQDGDLDDKEMIRIIVAVIVVALGIVPFLLVAHARDERLRREREAVRRQCEAVRAKGGQCDWSKAKGGTLRYLEPQLDHSIKKPYHTGRIKEARKPPSADGT